MKKIRKSSLETSQGRAIIRKNKTVCVLFMSWVVGPSKEQKSKRERQKNYMPGSQVLELQAYATMPNWSLFYSFLFTGQTWCLPVVS